MSNLIHPSCIHLSYLSVNNLSIIRGSLTIHSTSFTHWGEGELLTIHSTSKGVMVVVFESATGQDSVPLLRAVTERSRHQAVYNSATVT